MGSIIAIPSGLISCKKAEEIDPNSCTPTPTEIAGPFPIKTPADLVRENIIGDRTGVALLINFVIQNTNDDCAPLEGASVDLWHCDAGGNYSEYGGQLEGDFTNQTFCRGRQKTDANGMVSFITIYPGWYPGRAPHLHLEVKDANGRSLLVTQTAFPEDISSEVYTTAGYKGDFDTSNTGDNFFRDSIQRNLADSVSGNTTDGYVMTKVIKVAG